MQSQFEAGWLCQCFPQEFRKFNHCYSLVSIQIWDHFRLTHLPDWLPFSFPHGNFFFSPRDRALSVLNILTILVISAWFFFSFQASRQPQLDTLEVNVLVLNNLSWPKCTHTRWNHFTSRAREKFEVAQPEEGKFKKKSQSRTTGMTTLIYLFWLWNK